MRHVCPCCMTILHFWLYVHAAFNFSICFIAFLVWFFFSFYFASFCLLFCFILLCFVFCFASEKCCFASKQNKNLCFRITRQRNLALFIFPSNKIIVIILYAFFKPCFTVWRASCEVWTQLRSIHVLHRLSVLPPPHVHLSDMRKDLYMYTEFWGTIPQYTVLLSLCLVTLWFSTHHHHHWQDPRAGHNRRQIDNKLFDRHCRLSVIDWP